MIRIKEEQDQEWDAKRAQFDDSDPNSDDEGSREWYDFADEDNYFVHFTRSKNSCVKD